MAHILPQPHIDTCDCTSCLKSPLRPSDVPENPYAAVATMPQHKHDNDGYETASDSDNDRARKDELIRKAPYLPRVQVWARDGGPYTLKVGNQWFHCDDLLINGVEYQRGTRGQPHQSDSAAVYPASRSSRPDMKRNQSYTRTRPSAATASTSTISTPRSSGERMAPQSQYQPQVLPTPREQADRRRLERSVYKIADRQQLAPSTSRRERRDSGIGVSPDLEAQAGQLVPYSHPQSTSRPSLGSRQPSRSMRQATRQRPGVPRRGSSFDVPVRSKARKNVRFAPLPAA